MATPVWTDVQRRARLVRRHHLARTGTDPLGVTRDLVALHSSDPVTPPLALWARTPDATVEAHDAALHTDRTLWRLHAMRRTLWVVATADAPMVMAAASADVAAAERRKLLGWIAAAMPEVDAAAWLAARTAEVREVLADGQLRTTAELSALLPALRTPLVVGSGRWAAETPVSSRLLFLAAMDGHIVRGPSASWRSSQYRWADVGTWFGAGADPTAAGVTAEDPIPPETARAQLAGRWLTAFGPATTDDLRWWTGWTVARTRAALAAIDAVEVATESGPAWVRAGDARPDPPLVEPVVSLLPGLDPTVMGWKQRGFHLDEATAARVFDRNGNAGPTAVADGRVVGAWGQRPDGEVVLELVAELDRAEVDLLHEEAGRLTRWLDGTVVTPRFPSPASRELMR